MVYEDKVSVVDDERPQVFDPSFITWSSWPSPPIKSGNAPLVVGWKDTIVLFGGIHNRRGVQVFNIAEQTWTVIDSSQVPMEIYWSSGLALYNGSILIVGSGTVPFYNLVALYNPFNNTWDKLEDAPQSRCGTRLVQLGSRVFAVDGFNNDLVEEFVLETETWKPVEVELLIKRDGYHSLLALPAILFSHLPGGCHGVE